IDGVDTVAVARMKSRLVAGRGRKCARFDPKARNGDAGQWLFGGPAARDQQQERQIAFYHLNWMNCIPPLTGSLPLYTIYTACIPTSFTALTGIVSMTNWPPFFTDGERAPLPRSGPSGPSSRASICSGSFGAVCLPQLRPICRTPVRSTGSVATQPSAAGKSMSCSSLYLNGVKPFLFSIPVKYTVLLRKATEFLPVSALTLLPPLSV